MFPHCSWATKSEISCLLSYVNFYFLKIIPKFLLFLLNFSYDTIALNKFIFFQQKNIEYFSYFSRKTYVVGTH